MRRRAFGVSLAFMVVFLIGASSGRLVAQQLHTVPFDESLSIYVGHNGTWMNYNAGQEEEEEIEDAVAVFQSWEEASDEPEVWAEHQVNNPQPPEGWAFFTPVEEEPMELHVIVRDTQNRLGQVVITDWDTSATIGTLSANGEGSEIDGTVAVSPTAEAFHLDVQARTKGATLFHAGAMNPEVKDAVAVAVPFGWYPNHGDDHGCWYVSQGPWGDPRSAAEKESEEDNPWEVACAGPKDFTNDSNQVLPVPPCYILDDKQMVENTVNWPGAGVKMAKLAAEEVDGVVTGVWGRYDNGNRAFPDYSAPPYSQGTAHWPCEVQGELYAILYLPYYGRDIYKGQIKGEVSGEVFSHRAEALGTHDPAGVLAAKVALTVEQKTVWRVDNPVALGNVWGLMVRAPNPPMAPELSGITAPVTFELWADLPPGFIGGTGSATKDAADTTPPPPYPMPPEVALNFPDAGESQGRCTVELGKGWKWKATGEPSMAPYSGGELAPFPVVGPITKRIECHLEMLLCLKIKTVSEGGENVEANVELERQVGGEWWLEDSGQSTQRPNGEYIWSPANPLAPGGYRARAAGMGGWSDWLQFLVAIGLEHTETVTVPEERMEP